MAEQKTQRVRSRNAQHRATSFWRRQDLSICEMTEMIDGCRS